MTDYDRPYVSPFHSVEECEREGHTNCMDIPQGINMCSSLCQCGEQESTDD